MHTGEARCARKRTGSVTGLAVAPLPSADGALIKNDPTYPEIAELCHGVSVIKAERAVSRGTA